MSKLLNKTKCELPQPITTAPLLQANTLTLILTEQISKRIVLTQQGTELHNINITHKNTSLCTMDHFKESVKIHIHECTKQGQTKYGKCGLHAVCESLALISNLTIQCMDFHLKNDKLTYTLQQSVESYNFPPEKQITEPFKHTRGRISCGKYLSFDCIDVLMLQESNVSRCLITVSYKMKSTPYIIT